MKSQVICTGITANKGEFKDDAGRQVAFDGTTFHLIVDIAEGGTKQVIGSVSRPFKFGDSKEIEKWQTIGKAWPAGGLLCDVEFGMAASGEGTKLTLKSIRPAPAKAAA